MKLSALLAGLGLPALTTPSPAPNPTITAITHNSAWVKPGTLFVAITGATVDGHNFIPDAISNGAAAIAGTRPATDFPDLPVPYIPISHARQFLADAAAEIAGHPSRGLKVVGITGTDGKTTTSWLTRHLLRSGGIPTGLLSTVGYELADGVLQHFPAHFTTPEAPQVQEILATMQHAGAGGVVLESSSHALALDRVRAVEWDVAIWTNLTSEHLDFHGTVEQYFADKAQLIERSPFSVLNADDPWTPRLTELAPAYTTYSAQGNPADWVATNITQHDDRTTFTVCSPLGEFDADLPMIGQFNVANALAAMAAAAHLGLTIGQLQAGLASFGGVPGRMELLPRPQGCPRVIVDFAHTPASLESMLHTLRATTTGRLGVLIGSSGGRRDPSKRSPLGEVATRLADYAVFTEDDPRDTPVWEIIGQMEAGAAGRSNFTSIADREEAIQHIIGAAAPEDTVLLAGKGPEETIERLQSDPWNEVEVALAALAARANP